MPKPVKPKAHSDQPKQFYSAQPWQCRHHKTHSEIVAYVEASGAWEIIATINPTAGVSAETMARFICGLINDNQINKELLREAMEALELCLEEDDMTFSSEHAAEHAVANMKTKCL